MTRDTGNLKIFVWDDEKTLPSYTSGLIITRAEDLDDALKVIRETFPKGYDSYEIWDTVGSWNHLNGSVDESWTEYKGFFYNFVPQNYKIFDGKFAITQSGGD